MTEPGKSQSSPVDDVWGGVEHLKSALRQPELRAFDHGGQVTAAVRRAAYWVAVARGECRLSGVTAPVELGDVLSGPMALAAAEELKDFLRAWTDETALLGDRFDRCEPLEGEEITTSFVERRLEAWAALVAIDDAYVSVIEKQADAIDSLSDSLDEVLGALCEFDSALRSQAGLLSVATDTNLLENWRRMLAPEFQKGLPWVLDGTLEAVARKSWDVVLSRLEKPELWAKVLRHAAGQRVATPEAADESAPGAAGASKTIRLPMAAAPRRHLKLAASEDMGESSRGGTPAAEEPCWLQVGSDRLRVLVVGQEIVIAEKLKSLPKRVELDGKPYDLQSHEAGMQIVRLGKVTLRRLKEKAGGGPIPAKFIL